jgi:hypothetical protein
LYSKLDTSLNLPRQTAADGASMAECAASFSATRTARYARPTFSWAA